MIRQGEIYWLDLRRPLGSEAAFRRPCVVVQNDLLNASPIRTTLVCALTANLRRARAPHNVLLEAGEANLPEPTVVNVTQIFSINKHELEEPIGQLAKSRIQLIVQGVTAILEPL